MSEIDRQDEDEVERQLHRTQDEAQRQNERAVDEAAHQHDRAEKEALLQAGEAADEVNLLPAISRAASANAAKDELTVQALKQSTESIRQSKITRKVMYAIASAIFLGIGYLGWSTHDQNIRSDHNTQLLVCVAGSDQAFAKDLRILAATRGQAPSSDYKIPAGCQLVQ